MQSLVFSCLDTDTMLHFTLFSLAVLALVPPSGAMPADTNSANSAATFSFAQWAKEISEHPNGKHLSPEQAFEAFEAAHNQTGKRGKTNIAETMMADMKLTRVLKMATWINETQPVAHSLPMLTLVDSYRITL